MELEVQRLGQFEIIEHIGTGGMATVYKAYQPGLDRLVAIKVLPAQHAHRADFVDRFFQEAKTVAQLNHPNILPIYDVGVEAGLSYFVMKYVPGRTLKDLLGHPLDLATVSHYLDQVAGALDHAHEHGVVHRDVKPSNILMEDDWLLLADFGLAKIVMGSKELTHSGAVIGTPAYLSPEQASGEAVDYRADIYSLGIVLYEMVIGQVPYEAEVPMGIVFKHIYAPVPRPRRLKPDLPGQVEDVILKAMAKSPADRFDSAGEMAGALREAILRAKEPVIIQSPETPKPARLFISYKRNAALDQTLADYLYQTLSDHGHNVFIDHTLRTGDDWLAEIDKQIKESDFLVVLLSETSADSEMVKAEVKRAYEYRRLQGRPFTLPIRLAYEGLLPYSLDAFLDPLQYVLWNNPTDNERVSQEILDAIAGRLPQKSPAVTGSGHIVLSEDGGVITNHEVLPPPLPEFDPRFLEELEAPGGVVKLRDQFYIERKADTQLKREVVKAGSTTTIRASRQTGKSSLLVRGVHYARQQGAKIVNLDLQRVDADRLTAPELFLRDLAELIVRKLRLDSAQVEEFWQNASGPQDKLTYMMEDYVLPETDTSIILALDEVDRLLNMPFHSDFFALLRSWHNSRALDEEWDKLNIVMVISTEPYQLISDVNQSPFNVGLKIYLEDFNREQIADLNHRYNLPVSEADFPELVKLFGGQPYLTRKALYTLVTEQLTWPQLMAEATADHGPFGDHLRRHHWLLRDEPDLIDALKHVIEHERCPDEMALFRLLQAGLVKGSGDFYASRCELYTLYFKDKLL